MLADMFGLQEEKKVEDSMGYTLKEGNYEKLGVQIDNNALVFTFEGEKEDDCAILLYRKDHRLAERLVVPAEYCMGSVRSVRIEGLSARNLMYNYEINGEIRTDAYARRIIGREKWHDLSREKHHYRIYGGCLSEHFDWALDSKPEVPKGEMFIYKLHVRSFSMDAGLQGKIRGTFAAVNRKIPYLKSLGVTTVEFMPIYEFEELVFAGAPQMPPNIQWKEEEGDLIVPPREHDVERVNCWGYVQGNYFAVKASYGSTDHPSMELKELILELHKNGMEAVMEMYFDDNMNQNIILDALRFWVREYHVDGFHLLGASVPVTAAAQDMFLSRTKLFSGGFEPILFERKSAFPRLFVYKDEYLYPVRRALNHISADMNQFLCQQRKQHDVQGFVNYVAGNNGFTLYDLFAYQDKHNEANGENNRDGSDWNFSSNCGCEGRSGRKAVNELRRRQLLNALVILMMGQGVPLLMAGDEFGNSQGGNNNAYCQDNRTGWLNWKKGEKFAWLTQAVRKLAEFRGAHPIICKETPMQMRDDMHRGFPDLSYHSLHPWVLSVSAAKEAVGLMYYGCYGDDCPEDFVYIAYNFHNGMETLALPKLPEKKCWYLVIDTSRGKEAFLETPERAKNQYQLQVDPQSIAILTGKSAGKEAAGSKSSKKRKG